MNSKSKKFIVVFVFVFLLLLLYQSSNLYITESEPRPIYCDDCLIPLKEEIMQNQATYQMFVILSMITVNMLKTFGIYFMMKQTDSELRMNPAYIVSAVLGVFVGYGLFLPIMAYEGTYINIFMTAGTYALGANLLFDFAGKMKEKNP